MIELNYKEFGQGDPVIILHGLFGTLDNWKTMATRLAEDYMVFIIDQRNHGKSPHTDEFSYHLLAEDLREFMEANWMYKARIIGHSMGGKTAMRFALDNPDMVEQLVVVDIAPQKNERGHDQIFNAMLSLDIANLENRKQADAALLKNIPDFGVRQFLLKNLARNPEGGFRWKMNLSVLHEKYEEILVAIDSEETLDAPTLFLNGGSSGYVTDHHLDGIKKRFPNFEQKTIEGAGHWVHAEAPDQFLSIVRAFFSS